MIYILMGKLDVEDGGGFVPIMASKSGDKLSSYMDKGFTMKENGKMQSNNGEQFSVLTMRECPELGDEKDNNNREKVMWV